MIRGKPAEGDQPSVLSAFFFASRLRATSAAAAPPNNRIIGGAGTGDGPPDDPLDP